MPSTSKPVRPDLLGRFDQSFFIKMVVSFLVFTLAVAVLEIGIRYVLVRREFSASAPETEAAAERLANDVRSIMLNRGGPVASRTIYPILQRNFERTGLQIAIEPSELTRTSIERLFEFTPRGIPAEWQDGRYNEGRVDIRAEDFCLQCHTGARVGQVLGTVTVRDYLGTRLDGWKEEVRLTGGLNLVTIVIHSVILFFLLRALLGPLLSLRAAVARLAKGAGGISTRAEVRSNDEFGELAHDLNAFLDRVDHMLRDLERTIGKMVAVATRLAQVTGQAGKQLEGVEGALSDTVSPEDVAARDPVRTAADLANLDQLLDTLDQGLGEADPADRARIAEVRGRLEAARAGWERYARMTASVPRLIHEVHGLRHMIQEIGFLEEHLADVAESGRDLLGRVLRPREGDQGEASRTEAVAAPTTD